MPLVQGDLLNGRYRIKEVLGHGGMGSVYRAHDESLDVDVAVKENLFTTEDYARQFRLEAVILASLRHPNLPRVSDHFVLPDQGQYLVMDYIEGPDLRQILEKNGPISEEEAIRIGTAICDALSFLHSRTPAVLHRDIKLGNIKLVPDGHIALVDFGLAKIIEGDQPTMTGARAMTPGYSPPEQYGSSRTDARSDIYSLGATLYAAITGFIPEDSLARALDGLELTPITKRNPKISQRLASVIEKAMETSQANRYQSAAEFKQALIDAGSEPSSQATTAPEPSQTSLPAPAILPEKPAANGPARILFTTIIVAIIAIAGLFLATPEIFPFQIFPTITSTATATHTNSPSPAPATVAPATLTATAAASPTSSPTRIPPTATAIPSPTPIPVPLATPIGGGNGKIAFVTTREGTPQIYTMNADGSQQERLFLAKGGACQPAWSPDGTKLAYISPCSGRQVDIYIDTSILIYDLSTGETITLPSTPGGDFDPSWSPDGQSIVFASRRTGMPLNPYPQIYKINLADNIPIRLTNTDSTIFARYPAWSRDGLSILYALNRRGIWELWRMSADGENPTRILLSGGFRNDTHPIWGSTDTLVYFTQTDRGTKAPYRLMQLEIGQDQAVNLNAPVPLRDPSLSMDGQLLVAEGTDGNNIDIYSFDLLTKTLQALTSDPEDDFEPDWQP